uniref:ADP-ribosyl cyclase/cyclic ADP-ribose hydrolase n=1 Tax=Sparus aurata TaxID=8175 RepID=A0A671WET4_SPAAU
SKVAMEDYDDLMAMAPFDHPCHQTMFWSKTNELVRYCIAKDEDKKDCFTLEDTLLGYILNDKTWCVKKGSIEMFTTFCQEYDSNENTAVRSFWNRVSVAFAEYACGNATVMLNGSLKNPFDTNSTFAKFEINRLEHPKVTKLKVILVGGDKNVQTCKDESLQVLENITRNEGISYHCVPVTR